MRTNKQFLASALMLLGLASPSFGAVCKGHDIPCIYQPGPEGFGVCDLTYSQNPSKAVWQYGSSTIALRDQVVEVHGTIVEEGYGGFATVEVFGSGAYESTARMASWTYQCPLSGTCVFQWFATMPRAVQWTRVEYVRCITPGCMFSQDIMDHVSCGQ